jgi:peptidoglycan-associated lipoprotein
MTSRISRDLKVYGLAAVGTVFLTMALGCSSKPAATTVDQSNAATKSETPAPETVKVDDVSPGFGSASGVSEGGTGVTSGQKGGTATGAFEDVRFDFNDARIRDDQRDVVDRIAENLRKGQKTTVVLEGNTDERGTESYNMALGEARAEAVRRYLVALGIDEGRLSIVSFGESRPAENGTSEEAFAKNRRVHVNPGR